MLAPAIDMNSPLYFRTTDGSGGDYPACADARRE
jgi:hypothetical protein